MKKLLTVLLSFLLLATLPSLFVSAESAGDSIIAIVFTHDMHSHVESFGIDGKSVGGFARIKTFIDDTKSKYKNTLVVDGGDFSMGTLFQTLYRDEAPELRLLGAMGYDAVTIGNHEFDYGADGLTDMLKRAKDSGDTLPQILNSNMYVSDTDSEYNVKMSGSMAEYGVKEYTFFELGGYKIAVFGLLGQDARDCAPNGSIAFNDTKKAATRIVSEIKSISNPDLIVCLSHSGTGESVDDEDIELAKAVPDIDIIISGHTHSELFTPITVGTTTIVSCGEYGRYVGRLLLKDDNGSISVAGYSLVEMNESIKEDQGILDMIESFKPEISAYLEKYGFTDEDEILCVSPYDFGDQEAMYDTLAESTLGNLISDSYISAVKAAEGDNYEPVAVAAVPVGVIRSSIGKGNVTVSDAFEISSLGMGADDSVGYPLCSVYLTGRELRTLAEVDASVSLIMPAAQLYCSGLKYSWNTNRMLLNRVYDCSLYNASGEIDIDNDKLYRVVAGLYSAQMLGTVNGKSFGLLSLTPKDRNGNAITDFSTCIIKNFDGSELKEWKALADYLASFEKNDSGVSVIPEKYSAVEGRKTPSASLSPYELFSGWTLSSWVVLALILLIILIIVLIVVSCVRKKRKKRRAVLARSPELE